MRLLKALQYPHNQQSSSLLPLVIPQLSPSYHERRHLVLAISCLVFLATPKVGYEIALLVVAYFQSAAAEASVSKPSQVLPNKIDNT